MGLVWPHGVVQEMSRRVGPLFQPDRPTVEKGGRRPTAWPRVGRTQKTWMSRPPPGKWRLGYGVTWVWPELCGCPPEPAVCRRQADATGTTQLHLLLTLYGNPTLISGWGMWREIKGAQGLATPEGGAGHPGPAHRALAVHVPPPPHWLPLRERRPGTCLPAGRGEEGCVLKPRSAQPRPRVLESSVLPDSLPFLTASGESSSVEPCTPGPGHSLGCLPGCRGGRLEKNLRYGTICRSGSRLEFASGITLR